MLAPLYAGSASYLWRASTLAAHFLLELLGFGPARSDLWLLDLNALGPNRSACREATSEPGEGRAHLRAPASLRLHERPERAKVHLNSMAVARAG